MKQKELSIALKAIIALCALIVAVLACGVLPVCGFKLMDAFPSDCALIRSVLIFLWITCIPVIIVLVLVWQIATQIGRNNSFFFENAHNMKLICFLSMTDTLLYFFAAVALLFLRIPFPPSLLLTILILCLGIAISVVSAVFSHLVQKGAEMKAEQELTI